MSGALARSDFYLAFLLFILLLELYNDLLRLLQSFEILLSGLLVMLLLLLFILLDIFAAVVVVKWNTDEGGNARGLGGGSGFILKTLVFQDFPVQFRTIV